MNNHPNPFSSFSTAPPLPAPVPSNKHRRNVSRSPTRAPHRGSVTEDIFRDFAPARVLEAFKKPTGRLKLSMDAASLADRMVGMRAAEASMNIGEWCVELEGWEWPGGGGSLGFEIPTAKKMRMPNGGGVIDAEDGEYLGSLPSATVFAYERRIHHIQSELADFNMEEIKQHVLETHFIPSRPSSAGSSASTTTFLSGFTKMEDFTAVVTATVLKALPNLGRLTRLMDVWSIRLGILRRVPRVLQCFEDAEVALQSAWTTLQKPQVGEVKSALVIETFEVMRNVLQDKVGRLGRDLDYMLDTLEGREDTLPDAWLDRMEAIEVDYGHWNVAGDRKVREGEWAKQAKFREQQNDEAQQPHDEPSEQQPEIPSFGTMPSSKDAHLQALNASKEHDIEHFERGRTLTVISPSLLDSDDVHRTEDLLRSPPLLKADQQSTPDHLNHLLSERMIISKPEAINGESVVISRSMMDHEQQAFKKESSSYKSTNRNLPLDHSDAIESRKPNKQEDIHSSTSPTLPDSLAPSNKESEAEGLGARACSPIQHSFPSMVDTTITSNISRPTETEDTTLAPKSNITQAMPGDHSLKCAPSPKNNDVAPDSNSLKVVSFLTSKPQEQSSWFESFSSENAQIQDVPKHNYHEDPSNSQTDGIDGDHNGSAFGSVKENAQGVPNSQDSSVTQSSPKRMSHVEDPEITEEPKSPQKKALEAARRERAEVERLRAILESKRQSVVSPHVLQYLQGQSPSKGYFDEADTRNTAPLYGEEGFTEQYDVRDIADVFPATPSSSQIACKDDDLTTLGGVYDSDKGTEKALTAERPNQPLQIHAPMADYQTKTPLHEPEVSRDDDISQILSSSMTTKTPSGELLESNGVVNPSPIGAVFNAESPISDVHSSSRSTPRVLHTPTFGPLLVTQDVTTSSADPEYTQALDDHEKETPVKYDISRMKYSPETGTFSYLDATRDADFDKSKDTEGIFKGEAITKPLPEMPREHFHFHGYSTAEPTPEILEAEPTHYFHSLPRGTTNMSNAVKRGDSFTREHPVPLPIAKSDVNVPSVATHMQKLPVAATMLSLSGMSFGQDILPVSTMDSPLESRPIKEIEMKDFRPKLLERRASTTPIGSPSLMAITRKDSAQSSTSTVVNSVLKSPTSPRRGSPPPLRPMTPTSPRSPLSHSPYDASPSIRRHRNGKSHDYTSPDTPPAIPKLGSQSSLSPRAFGSFSATSEESTSPTSPVQSRDLPIISGGSPKKPSTDEQIQQQISSLLESIPARIHLTSSTQATPPSSTSLAVKKTRRSLGSTLRSSSTLSNYSTRAPTPSFTLAPAHSSTQPRQRPIPGNPEIKVYHLSRSTGEAPIKLFVRLVGEHGERVMVRVGGGWADLGEYLKEYASHHGRRGAIEVDDKVEIQDLPFRSVSGSSALARSGRDTPTATAGRSSSALHARPASSLAVRKTRKSFNESPLPLRNPSTPPPSHNSHIPPPPLSSVIDRSSSRLSWIEDPSAVSLGLAGPKGRRVDLEEKDQEWVDSIKEKVRLASAEKDREREKERRRASGVSVGVSGSAGEGRRDGDGLDGRRSVVGRRRDTSFGELDVVGGTRRVFVKKS